MKNKTANKLNLELYKEDSKNFKKLKNNLVKLLNTEILIQELKRRKLIHMNWETMKYDGNTPVVNKESSE